MDQTPSNGDIQKLLDDGVLEALKEIENSMKDGSLMSFTVANQHQVNMLPLRQYTFQVSLLHKKRSKVENPNS